jgi:hypothetical protein
MLRGAVAYWQKIRCIHCQLAATCPSCREPILLKSLIGNSEICESGWCKVTNSTYQFSHRWKCVSKSSSALQSEVGNVMWVEQCNWCSAKCQDPLWLVIKRDDRWFPVSVHHRQGNNLHLSPLHCKHAIPMEQVRFPHTPPPPLCEPWANSALLLL